MGIDIRTDRMPDGSAFCITEPHHYYVVPVHGKN
jgi:hypothetical protein